MGNQQSNAAHTPNQTSGAPSSSSSSSSSSSAAPSASATASASNLRYTQTSSNGTGTQTQAKGTVVTLNVYEPAKPQASMPGFGIYHTGIEISGVEYSFAGGPEAGSGTGVMTQRPRDTPADGQWKFKQAIILGTTDIPYKDFDKTLQELKDAFPANTYDLIHRNCNHFTTAVAKRLGVYSNYPSWVNRAASWGAVFSTPPKHLQPIEAPKPKESVFKTSTGYRLDGTKVEPKGKSKSEQKKAESDKKSQSSSSSSSAGKARKNPWADPSFVPPGMRDPVVAGFVPPGPTSSATSAPSTAN